ncbi:response regulator [Lederbergia sp. NSJ-179]|uniref:response regulator n=1 Tax=Lederbergia sp. NSJ-179 TaxID=2931402 RepID=UPI001FD22B2B|nr:response regulator [Lederbergia sp. NSJ-179]MCJ7843197.1 response regulator [Lederbergia sp. NSJ-179]
MIFFIVEDEYWALLELKTLLKKYQNEHTIYFYDNGEDACEEVPIYKPDLIVTDITMPGMDGLKLVQKVKGMDPKIKCILLTVHDTFDYAKKGIQLGVVDYLLKPIKKEALYKVMDHTIDDIKKNKQDMAEKEVWAINHLLLQPLRKSNHDLETFERQPLFLVYLLFGNWNAPVSGDHLNMDVTEFKREVGISLETWLLPLDQQRKLVLIAGENDQYFIDFVLSSLFRYFKGKEQVHISYIKKNEDHRLSEAYHQVHQLLDKYKRFGESSIIINDQENQKDISMFWTTVRVIERQIQQGELASINLQIKILIKQIKERRISQRQLFRFLSDMYYALIYKLQQTTNSIIQMNGIEETFAKLDCFVTFEELEDWMGELITRIAEAFSSGGIAPKHLIPKVRDWIEKSFADNITFQQFADEHHVSVSYLSREFKQQTKMTFSEYLMNYRIRKAQELFENGVERTVDVGSLVGYHDPKHFRMVFKRITGMTPREYKKRIKTNL